MSKLPSADKDPPITDDQHPGRAQDPPLQQDTLFLSSLRQNLSDQPSPVPLSERENYRSQALGFRNRAKNQNRSWQWVAFAACLVVLLQFAFVSKGPDRTSIPIIAVKPSENFLQIKLNSDATVAAISRLLQTHHAQIIAGPDARGIFRIKFENGSETKTQGTAALSVDKNTVEWIKMD